jgi:hypothetical protein
VHTWFGDMGVDEAQNWRKLVDWCVGGIMTSRPFELEPTLRTHPPPAGESRDG